MPLALDLTGVTVVARHPVSGAERTLLRDVHWRVHPGEHWALLGQNGAGKTTLLQVAAGAIRPQAGEVRVLGECHGAAGLADPRLRMGVLQAAVPRFASSMRAIDVVALRASGPVALHGSRVPREEVARADDLLHLMGCAHLRERRFDACSQGERQRILLARTLMRDPEILLLDEPATGLDLAGREGWLEAIVRLVSERRGLATVTVTHHAEELAPTTSHVLLLRDGATVAAGPAGETLTNPLLSRCFGMPVTVERAGGRWLARAARPAAQDGPVGPVGRDGPVG